MHEMRHRALSAGFRRGTWSGPTTRELRAKALSYRSPSVTLTESLVALSFGFAVGYGLREWLKHSHETHARGLDSLAHQ